MSATSSALRCPSFRRRRHSGNDRLLRRRAGPDARQEDDEAEVEEKGKRREIPTVKLLAFHVATVKYFLDDDRMCPVKQMCLEYSR